MKNLRLLISEMRSVMTEWTYKINPETGEMERDTPGAAPVAPEPKKPNLELSGVGAKKVFMRQGDKVTPYTPSTTPTKVTPKVKIDPASAQTVIPPNRSASNVRGRAARSL